MKNTTPIPETYEETGSSIRKELENEYKTDMIGLLEELPEILNIMRWNYSGYYKENYRKLETILNERNMTFEEKDPILCQVNLFANAAERDGFRRGFHVAMQICMEGMRRGLCCDE